MRIRLASLVSILFLSYTAFAQMGPPTSSPGMYRVKYSGSTGVVKCADNGNCAVLSGVALNSSAAARTMLFNVRGYSILGVQVNDTVSAATSLVLTCSSSRDNGATYASITSTNVSSGAGTLSVYTDNCAIGISSTCLTGTGNIDVTYDVRTYDWIKCVVSGTSGGSSDLITTKAIAAVGQES
jgi:hypothetical protein